jgi:excinuclease ABC subunit A
VVNGEERLYSQKLACTECGTSVPQLEPRSFSFNSPYGACRPAGFGNRWTFDPGSSRTFKAVAEAAWDPAPPRLMNHWLRGPRVCCADLSAPFEQLPKKTQKLLLDGGNGFRHRKISIRVFRSGRRPASGSPITCRPPRCPDCHGRRLRPTSLAVRVKSISIADFTAMPIARALLTARAAIRERERRLPAALSMRSAAGSNFSRPWVSII